MRGHPSGVSRDPSSDSLSRRRILHTLGGGTAVAAMTQYATRQAVAQDDGPLHRFPRMVHEFFVRQARESAARNRQRLQALMTRADAEAYVRSAQQRIRESFGAQPELTPLQARTTKVVDRDGYRIENVIFESRPGFPVTANFYLPKAASGPLPAVVGTCGHSANRV